MRVAYRMVFGTHVLLSFRVERWCLVSTTDCGDTER